MAPSLGSHPWLPLFTPSPSPYCALLFFTILIESWHIICVIVHLLLVYYYYLLRLTYMPHEGRDLLWFTMTSPVFPSRLGTKLVHKKGSPCGSGGKESTCNVEQLGSITGLGRSLEEGMAAHSSILGWRILMGRGVWWTAVPGVAESDTTEWLSTHTQVHNN